MRQARVIRYLVVAALLLLLAACGQFPGMRTNMPPVPAETPPGAPAPAPDQASAPAPDLAQQVQNLEARVQQLESRLAEPEGRRGAPAATKERAVPPPPTSSSPKPAVSSAAADKNYTEGMRLYHAKKFGDARHQLSPIPEEPAQGPQGPGSPLLSGGQLLPGGQVSGSRGGVQQAAAPVPQEHPGPRRSPAPGPVL